VLSDTEDLEHVERVGKNKSKKTKLDVYTPSDPIKVTPEPHSSTISENFSKQQNDSSTMADKPGVTAVMAVLVADKSHRSTKKSSTKNLSGSF
jgi:hypothetical protein